MTKHFSVDARAMLTWGRESIKDHTTAVLELVKNSYDANASIVEVEIFVGNNARGHPFIRIADDGIGMSSIDVEEHWLRLGFSAKRLDRFTARGRRKTGEKGVGRISADRLGAKLELRSQAANHSPVGLRVDWREFETPGRDLEKVPIQDLTAFSFLIPKPARWVEKTEEFLPPPPADSNSPSRSGTELVIQMLRQEWRTQDIQELRRLLSLLTPPFVRVKDFQVRLSNDVDTTCNGVITSPLYASAAIELNFSLNSKGRVNGKISHRARASRKLVVSKMSLPASQLVHQKGAGGGEPVPTDVASRLGPVTVQLLFYPQKAETVRGLDIDLQDLKQFLQANAGVRVYRDGIRVPPYGDQGKPEGDWLGLGDRKSRNPAGPHRPDFRVSPHQLVGAVYISRDSNPHLVDTSGREGLVAGEALGTLKSFIIGCLTHVESHYHKLYRSLSKTTRDSFQSPRDTVDELRVHLAELAASIKKAEDRIPRSASGRIGAVVEQLATATEKIRQAEKSFEELATQAAVSRTLATIGIASATFGHESQRGLDSLRATLEAAQLLLRNNESLDHVLEELAKALRESERVSAWGAFALGRIRRDKRVRRLIDVDSVVALVVDEIQPAMEASSITISRDLPSIKARIFAMDVECVVINLLTNAYYFAKQSDRDRRISVRIRQKINAGRRGFEIIVSDSGPGVSKALKERVWDALFTTKTDEGGNATGTGLGLALVDAVVQDVEGQRYVDTDPKLRGARFTVWLPGAGA